MIILICFCYNFNRAKCSSKIQKLKIVPLLFTLSLRMPDCTLKTTGRRQLKSLSSDIGIILHTIYNHNLVSKTHSSPCLWSSTEKESLLQAWRLPGKWLQGMGREVKAYKKRAKLTWNNNMLLCWFVKKHLIVKACQETGKGQNKCKTEWEKIIKVSGWGRLMKRLCDK